VITWIGVGIYMIGDGVRGWPNGNLIGSGLMVAGGIVMLVGVLVNHG
jgi:hypothetical protein